MSEKPAQLTARPPVQHSGATAKQLTPSERAAREIAQIDHLPGGELCLTLDRRELHEPAHHVLALRVPILLE